MDFDYTGWCLRCTQKTRHAIETNQELPRPCDLRTKSEGEFCTPCDVFAQGNPKNFKCRPNAGKTNPNHPKNRANSASAYQQQLAGPLGQGGYQSGQGYGYAQPPFPSQGPHNLPQWPGYAQTPPPQPQEPSNSSLLQQTLELKAELGKQKLAKEIADLERQLKKLSKKRQRSPSTSSSDSSESSSSSDSSESESDHKSKGKKKGKVNQDVPHSKNNDRGHDEHVTEHQAAVLRRVGASPEDCRRSGLTVASVVREFEKDEKAKEQKRRRTDGASPQGHRKRRRDQDQADVSESDDRQNQKKRRTGDSPVTGQIRAGPPPEKPKAPQKPRAQPGGDPVADPKNGEQFAPKKRANSDFRQRQAHQRCEAEQTQSAQATDVSDPARDGRRSAIRHPPRPSAPAPPSEGAGGNVDLFVEDLDNEESWEEKDRQTASRTSTRFDQMPDKE